MAKILVLVNSGPNEKLKVLSGRTLARVAHDRGAEVRVVFFADGARVTGGGSLAADPAYLGAVLA